MAVVAVVTAVDAAAVVVPPRCVGKIIGRSGGNIKALIAAHPGVTVQGPRRGAPTQVFRVQGPSAEAVAAAAAQIRRDVAAWQEGNARWQRQQQQQQRSSQQQRW